MSDNTTLPAGGAGDTVRTIDRAGVKTQVTQLDWGGEAGPEQLVVLANGLPVQPATGSTWAITAASLPLPSGASTDTKQDTGNTSVASIDTKTPALGQALAAASVPVVLTAAQVTTLTPPAAIAGFALEAGHLATIDTSTAKIPSQGQALAAASMPVVLTAAQVTTLTPPAAITNYALETGGNLATVKTNTDPLVTAAAGGYVRQDSTATIAKESGGNLATIAGKDFATQTTLATIAAAVKGEDTASADADKGIPAFAVRQDTPTNSTSDAGDYGPLKQDINGRLWVTDDIQVPLVRGQGDIMLAILTELRVMNLLLQTGLNVRDDIDSLRADAYFNPSLQ